MWVYIHGNINETLLEPAQISFPAYRVHVEQVLHGNEDLHY
jgi:hypothetical protein